MWRIINISMVVDNRHVLYGYHYWQLAG